ncbi:uncharacterized protein LOC113466854 [Diaphorina citri]|uniref:Uncharacterized protein LOC113466854 n=1 Tax=Diaphorina citri TaxID=121845 RepID=A0A3Q0IQ37_DIACI|nr:uncharacterized protein LOC113466854 [Diaphorina citri]
MTIHTKSKKTKFLDHIQSIVKKLTMAIHTKPKKTQYLNEMKPVMTKSTKEHTEKIYRVSMTQHSMYTETGLIQVAAIVDLMRAIKEGIDLMKPDTIHAKTLTEIEEMKNITEELTEKGILEMENMQAVKKEVKLDMKIVHLMTKSMVLLMEIVEQQIQHTDLLVETNEINMKQTVLMKENMKVRVDLIME